MASNKRPKPNPEVVQLPLDFTPPARRLLPDGATYVEIDAEDFFILHKAGRGALPELRESFLAWLDLRADIANTPLTVTEILDGAEEVLMDRDGILYGAFRDTHYKHRTEVDMAASLGMARRTVHKLILRSYDELARICRDLTRDPLRAPTTISDLRRAMTKISDAA